MNAFRSLLRSRLFRIGLVVALILGLVVPGVLARDLDDFEQTRPVFEDVPYMDPGTQAPGVVPALPQSSFDRPIPSAPSIGASEDPRRFEARELVEAGSSFFGGVSRGLGQVVEQALSRYGSPDAYILGHELSGAFIAGLRFGEGTIHFRNGSTRPIFWQGPSIGFDLGGDGARTMMLVYNGWSDRPLSGRFAGIDGSAYFVAGFGMTALVGGDTIVVPIRSGVGARLGLNLGYLRFTETPTWNPF